MIRALWFLFFGNSKRLRPEDVQPGENITIEHSQMLYRVGNAKCLSNDPEKRKMLIEINWTAPTPLSREIIFYSGFELRHFHLLNCNKIKTPKADEGSNGGSNIAELQKQMNDALDKEDYLLAEKLQQQINKIVNNK